MHKLVKYIVPLAAVPTTAPGYPTGHLLGSFELKRPAVFVSVRAFQKDSGSVSLTSTNVLGSQGGANPDRLRLVGTERLLPADAQYSLHMLDLRDFECPASIYDVRMNGTMLNTDAVIVTVLELDYSGFEN